MGASWIIPLITTAASTAIQLASRSGGPNYPSPPKLAKIPIAQATTQMEDYEAKRMQASIDAWKSKFPDLYKGGAYEIGDIAQQQKGMLGGQVTDALSRSGLETPVQGDQYRLSQDLGLSPITLSQRTSQAVTRQIAQNPEWTNKISGGTLATMMANNYQNQNAFSQFLGAQQTAMYAQGQATGAYNTGALLSGITNAASLTAQHYGQQQYGPLSPTGQGLYQGVGLQQQLPGTPAANPVYSPYGAPYGGQMMAGNTYGNTYGSNYGNNYMGQVSGVPAYGGQGYAYQQTPLGAEFNTPTTDPSQFYMLG